MKTIETERKRFLLENDYAEGIEIISSYTYYNLPEPVQSDYKQGKDGKFYKEAEFPSLTEDEFQQIVTLENDRKLRRMEEHLKVIKYCAVILAITTIISVISGIVSYCSYQSALENFENNVVDTDYDYYNF